MSFKSCLVFFKFVILLLLTRSYTLYCFLMLFNQIGWCEKYIRLWLFICLLFFVIYIPLFKTNQLTSEKKQGFLRAMNCTSLMFVEVKWSQNFNIVSSFPFRKTVVERKTESKLQYFVYKLFPLNKKRNRVNNAVRKNWKNLDFIAEVFSFVNIKLV